MDIEFAKILTIGFTICFVALILTLTKGRLKVKAKYKDFELEIERKKGENISSKSNSPVSK